MNDLDLALLDFLEAAKTAKGMKRVEPLMHRLKLTLRKAFQEQGARFIRKFRSELRSRFAEGYEGHTAFLSTPLQEALGPLDWLAIWYEVSQTTVKLFSDPINQAVQQALQIGAVTSLGQIGMNLSFSLDNPRAVAYLKNYGAKLVSGINDTTRNELQAIITQAADDGWSYGKTADAITNAFNDFSIERGELIATKEIGDAYCEGNLEVALDMQAAGLEMEKSWSTAGDGCEKICQPNAEAGWIPLDQEFPSGHQRPLGHPGCWCDLKIRRKGS